MGQALKDQRCAESAAQADSYMRWYWKYYIVGQGTPTSASSYPQPDFTNAFINPNQAVTAALNSTSPGLSYPVFVDPMGYSAPWHPSSMQHMVAGLGWVPRSNLAQLGSWPNPLRVCSMLDGFTYNQSGWPTNPNGGVERDMRYNWLWVLQQQNIILPPANSTVTMTIVVYDKRAPLFAPVGSEIAFPPVTVQPGSTSITLPYSGGRPPLLKGGWVLDPGSSDGNPSSGKPPSVLQANFYRAISVIDTPSVPATTPPSGTLSLELQTPIFRTDGQTAAYTSRWVYLAGVSEVFTRNNLTNTNQQ